jgi:hypothetical protein
MQEQKIRKNATRDAASPGHVHAIKQNVDLVLVPVSVTDGRQRLVTGLDQSNFQVLEGKKVQEIIRMQHQIRLA